MDGTFNIRRIGRTRPLLVWAALGVILAVAGWLRCQRLSEVSYWFDESFSMKMSEFSIVEIWNRCAQDTSPPFSFWLLKGWRAAFGTSALAQRSLSVILGLLTVAGTFLFVREAYRREPSGGDGGTTAAAPALLAAALVALSPFHVYWSSQVRMYPLAAALATLSSWLLMRALRRPPPRRADWCAYTCLAVLLAYTHHFGLICVGVQLLFAIGFLWFHPTSRARDASWWRVSPALLSAFCVELLWQFWLPAFLSQRQRVESGFWSRSLTWDEIGTTTLKLLGAHEWTWSEGFLQMTGERAVIAGLVLGQVVIVGLVLLQLGRRAADMYVALAAALPIALTLAVSATGTNIFIPRYLLVAHMFLLIAAAVLLTRVRPRWLSAFRCLGAVLVGVNQARSRYDDWERQAAHPGMRAAMARLDELRAEGEPLVVCNPMLYTTAVAYSTRRDGIYTIGSDYDYPFYQGTAAMSDADYLPRSGLTDGTYDVVWTLDANQWWGSNWSVRMPHGWLEVASTTVPEFYCQLQIRLYEREPGVSSQADAVAQYSQD